MLPKNAEIWDKGCLPTKVIFQFRSSSTEGRLPIKVVFYQRLSSTEGHFQMKFVFHRRSSSNKCRLPPKVVFPEGLLHYMTCFIATVYIFGRCKAHLLYALSTKPLILKVSKTLPATTFQNYDELCRAGSSHEIGSVILYQFFE